MVVAVAVPATAVAACAAVAVVATVRRAPLLAAAAVPIRVAAAAALIRAVVAAVPTPTAAAAALTPTVAVPLRLRTAAAIHLTTRPAVRAAAVVALQTIVRPRRVPITVALTVFPHKCVAARVLFPVVSAAAAREARRVSALVLPTVVCRRQAVLAVWLLLPLADMPAPAIPVA